MMAHDDPLLAVVQLSNAAKVTPPLLQPGRQQQQFEATLSKLCLQSERVGTMLPAGGAEAEDCAKSCLLLLDALADCAGRLPLHSRSLVYLAAANRILAAMFAGNGVTQQRQQEILERVQLVRRRAACQRSPERPAVSLSLVGLQLTRLEAGAICLPIKGEKGAAAAAGVKLIMGAAKV